MKSRVLLMLGLGLLLAGGCHTPSAPPAPPPAPPSPASAPSPSAAPVAASPAVRLTTEKHPETGLTLDLPDDWEHAVKEQGRIVVTKPDQTAVIVIWTGPAGTPAEAADKSLPEVARYVAQPTPGAARAETVNGVEANRRVGSGARTSQGKTVEWSLTAFRGDEGKTLMVLAVATARDHVLDVVHDSVRRIDSEADKK